MSVHHTPFHIVAKPIGALCNMNCSYCFYAEKKIILSCYNTDDR